MGRERDCGRSREWIAGLIALVWFAACNAPAASPKRVLILQSFGPGVAPYNAVAAGFRSTLSHEMDEPVDVYEVSLDVNRFNGPGMEKPFVEFLEERFSGHGLDLVVPIGAPASKFALQYGDQLFPQTPMVFTALDPRIVPPDSLRTNATLVTQRLDLVGIIDDILRLQADTTNVVVVLGDSPLERFWAEECRREWQSYTNRVQFTWLGGLTLHQIQHRVGTLPPRSIVFFGMLIMDAEGVPHDGYEALAAVHSTAKAPVYGCFRSQLGHGTVGGRLYDDDRIGEQGAKAAIRILHGERAGDIPPEYLNFSPPVYDWRELKRWGIQPSQLPMNSIVEFRPPNLWEQYRGRIAGVFALCCLQTALIVGLIVNRVKRRQSEARLNALIDESAVAIGIGREGNVTYANKKYLEMFGYKDVSEIIGRPITSVWAPEFEEMISERLRRRRLGLPLPPEFEGIAVRKDGSRIPVHAASNYMEMKDGPTSVVFITDITERKRAEEALQCSELKYRRLHESMMDAFVSFAMDGRILQCNASYQSMLGYSLPELLKMTYADLTPEKWHNIETKIIADQVVASGASDVYQKEYRRKDGTLFPVELRTFLIRDDAGRPAAMWAIVRDVTERNRAHAALKQSEERLRLVLEANSEGVWDWNIPTGKTFFNRQYSAMLGYEPEEFAANYQQWKALVHPDDFERVHIAHTAHIHLGKEFRVEFRMRKKSGDWCWVLSRGTVVERDADDRAIRMLGTHQDVTERRHADLEREYLSRELAHAGRVSTMGALTASLAHELNQPLSAILSNAQAGLRFLHPDISNLHEVRGALEDIAQDTRRAGEVIRQMRALVRKDVPKLQPLDLNRLISEVIRLLHSDMVIRRIRLTLDLLVGLPNVSGDNVQLQQVMLNLVLNAFDALRDAPDKRRLVTVRTRLASISSAQVEVCDGGTGFAPERLLRPFEPFRSTKRDGLGLGLSISHSIIDAHHGRLWAQNNLECGATLFFTLPIYQER